MGLTNASLLIMGLTNASLALVFVRWDVQNNTWMISEILRTLIVNIDYQVSERFILYHSASSQNCRGTHYCIHFSQDYAFGMSIFFLDFRDD